MPTRVHDEKPLMEFSLCSPMRIVNEDHDNEPLRYRTMENTLGE